jgi:hypothetical protein
MLTDCGPWLGHSTLDPTTASAVSSSFKASPVSSSSGVRGRLGRFDASEPRQGLRESRRADVDVSNTSSEAIGDLIRVRRCALGIGQLGEGLRGRITSAISRSRPDGNVLVAAELQ